MDKYKKDHNGIRESKQKFKVLLLIYLYCFLFVWGLYPLVLKAYPWLGIQG